MKTIIHVNQHKIKANRKHGKCDPPITVKTYKSNDYCHCVDILDAGGNVVATVLYRPQKPLSCGARVWLECKHGVKIHNDCNS